MEVSGLDIAISEAQKDHAYGGIATASKGDLFETFAIPSVTERRARA